MAAPQRLDKILSTRGYCTRSQTREFLEIHDVAAGGKPVEKPDAKIDGDTLTIDGAPADPASLIVLMHKPVGYVCSRTDSGQIVYELLPPRWFMRNPPMATVGRLDKDTSGLLLIVDDGQLLHRLTSPKWHVPRVYVATLRDPLRGDEGRQFSPGTLMLEGEDKPLLPVESEVLGTHSMRLTLHEGRYHQVRRMFQAVGNEVVTLHRETFGRLDLGGLEPGQWRVLPSAEAITG